MFSSPAIHGWARLKDKTTVDISIQEVFQPLYGSPYADPHQNERWIRIKVEIQELMRPARSHLKLENPDQNRWEIY
jgi:hypothetical protein